MSVCLLPRTIDVDACLSVNDVFQEAVLSTIADNVCYGVMDLKGYYKIV